MSGYQLAFLLALYISCTTLVQLLFRLPPSSIPSHVKVSVDDLSFETTSLSKLAAIVEVFVRLQPL